MKRELHVVLVEWEQYRDKKPTSSVGYLVSETKTGILLAGTYDEEFDCFPVSYGVPNNKVISMKTMMIIKADRSPEK